MPAQQEPYRALRVRGLLFWGVSHLALGEDGSRKYFSYEAVGLIISLELVGMS